MRLNGKWNCVDVVTSQKVFIEHLLCARGPQGAYSLVKTILMLIACFGLSHYVIDFIWRLQNPELLAVQFTDGQAEA